MTTTTLTSAPRTDALSRFIDFARVSAARIQVAPSPVSRAERARHEARRVRRLADAVARNDPAFAADLCAAAARHEMLHVD